MNVYMKNSNLGWPSSDRRKMGLENDVNNWMRRVEATTVRSLKYGARLAKAMIRPGYREFSIPDVEATIAYTAYVKGINFLIKFVQQSHTLMMKSAAVPAEFHLAGNCALTGFINLGPNAGSADSV